MYMTYIALGAIVGLMLGLSGGAFIGLFAGGALAYLWARQNDLVTERAWLNKQIKHIQEQLKELRATGVVAQPAAPPVEAKHAAATQTPESNLDKAFAAYEQTKSLAANDEPPAPAEPLAPATPQRAAKDVTSPVVTRSSEPLPTPATTSTSEPKPATAGTAEWATDLSRKPNKPNDPDNPYIPDGFERLIEAGKRWLTTGNVPVKLGLLVSFFGVSFLLKYAVDSGFLVISLEFRYLLVALAAIGLFAFGWRLRDKMRVYSLSLQGGAIGILFLTVFAAYRLHPILPGPIAIILLVSLAVALGGLAVIENSLTLAVLGVVGGFLAPILIATSNNHVALFGYYLILNGAILGIAWHKPWRILNLLGFGFTFVIASIWGGQYYRPEYFSTTEPFLIAYFIFYQAIAILYAFRQPPNLRGLVDGTLVFGTPGVAFALQAALLNDTEYGLAISAAIVAVMYGATSYWLYSLKNDKMRLLVESYFSLAVAFATLAIPLALDDRWTSVAWALEGAALVWVGVRQSRLLSKYSGIVLLFGSGFSYMNAGWEQGLGIPILNGNVISGILIALLSLLSANRLRMDAKKIPGQNEASIGLMLWGLAWWLGIGTAEIIDRLDNSTSLHVVTAFLALTGIAWSVAAKRIQWQAAQQITLALLPAFAFVALGYLDRFGHALAGAGFIVWLIAFGAHFIALRLYEQIAKQIAAAWHYSGAMLLAAIIVQDMFWRVGQVAVNDVWADSSAMFMMTALAVGLAYARPYLAWPLQQHEASYTKVSVSLVVAQLTLLTIASLGSPGNPSPLPYIPLLNPFDALTILGMGVAFYSLRPGQVMSRLLDASALRTVMICWAALAFLLSTVALVRGVHFIAHVPWRDHQLMSSVAVQSSLSIYWAILGLSGMILGARKAHRSLWIVGAGLMVLVVGKLFLIDLGNSGTIARIISFLGVGGMLLVVGYFAPAPPRESDNEEKAEA